jgi:large subunit ribosomal protein L35Ae
MEGIIAHFRGSRRRKRGNYMLINIASVDSKEKAEALVGKAVTWKSPGTKEIKGKITAAHGNSGIVRAIFETGMPGQSLGTTVTIA